MWKQVFAPTLVVVVIWIVFSVSTSRYIQWLDQMQSRLLEENVSSIRAASTMQECVWKMESLAFNTRGNSAARLKRLETLKRDFRDNLQVAYSVALAPGESEIVQEISTRFDEYCLEVQGRVTHPEVAPAGPAAIDSVETIIEPCQRLQQLNANMLKQESSERQELSATVLMVRAIVLVLGPALGIGLGLRISRKLHRSISEISITLKDAAGALDREIGQVSLSTNVDLPDLHRQVQSVGVRIRQIVGELQTARQEVLRAERLAAVGELAAGVAHELRNPMTSVKLLLQSAMQRNRNQGDRQFQVILEELARMENTIQGLLDFARPQRLRRVTHDIMQTVGRALNLVDGRARQQNVQLKVELAAVALEVNGDPEQLHQVFINLLLNALEAMPNGGLLHVNVGQSESGKSALVTLSDTGSGIPDEVLTRLFEPFVTTKDRGTGLGLAISRRIIDDHHGRLWADNCPEGGTVFSVELPLQTGVEKISSPANDALGSLPGEHLAFEDAQSATVDLTHS